MDRHRDRLPRCRYSCVPEAAGTHLDCGSHHRDDAWLGSPHAMGSVMAGIKVGVGCLAAIDNSARAVYDAIKSFIIS